MKHKVTRIRKRRKKQVVDAFGGKCVLCGYDKCLNALHFHHVDPSLKTMNPTKVINEWSVDRSIEQLQREKTILVCSNCHAEIHYEDYDFELQKKICPVIKINCEQCSTVFYQVDIPSKTKQRFCSSECYNISNRKVERPNKQELEKLLEKYSYVRVGKMFNVSDRAIRKWVKVYSDV